MCCKILLPHYKPRYLFRDDVKTPAAQQPHKSSCNKCVYPPSPVDTPVFEITSYLGLFLAAFGAASLLPMQSEAVLVAMLLSGKYAVTTLLIVATLGNVLGSILNWLLGRSAGHPTLEKPIAYVTFAQFLKSQRHGLQPDSTQPCTLA